MLLKRAVSLLAALGIVLTISTSMLFAEETVSTYPQEDVVVEQVNSEEPAEAEVEDESTAETNQEEAPDTAVTDTQADESQNEAEVVPQAEEVPDVVERAAFSTSIADVAALEAAVNAAADGEVILLADDFVSSAATLTMPAVNVVIDGGNKVWTDGKISVEGNGTGSITIKNLKIDGTNIDGKLLTNTATAGILTLENMEFYHATKGALDISTKNEAHTKIIATLIRDNKASNSAPAIWLGTTANVTIDKSTVKDNVGTGGGYETGAISSKNYEAKLDINNTVFRNNVNESVNTGIFGGGGGAMAMHYMRGTININESIFDSNKTNGEKGDVKSTYDGGALYIFDGRDGAILNIDKTTFMNNIAYDDGGAMMIQGTGNPGLTTTITNSTFYGNKAYGLDGAGYSGGAIQFFKNGGSSKMTNNALSCTFVGNVGGSVDSTTEQRGGAIGLSGAGIFATAAVTRNNCLFIGNNVYGADGVVKINSNYKDISNYATVQAGTTNVANADKGEQPAYTTKDILGVNTPVLATNGTDTVAGVDNEKVPTIMIRPESIADNTYTGTAAVPDVDQRNQPRYRDQGAVEMSWIKYVANGGMFNGMPEETNNYYELNEEEQTDIYYSIGVNGKASIIMDGNESFDVIAPVGKIFVGWSTDENATEADTRYTPGSSITYTQENLMLYAVWADTFTVTYDANDTSGTVTGTVPVDGTNYKTGDTVTVLDNVAARSIVNGTLDKPGYLLTGWNTAADGSGTTYQAGDTFVMGTENVVLYAMWEVKAELTVTYHGNGHTAGDAPVDTQSPYAKDALVTALTKGDLAKEGYTFTGWNTQADGTGTAIAENAQFTIVGNVDLYAQWTKNEVPPTSTAPPTSTTPPASTTPPTSITPPSSTGDTVAKTGDVGIMIPIAILAVSVAGIACAVMVLHKNKSHNI